MEVEDEFCGPQSDVVPRCRKLARGGEVVLGAKTVVRASIWDYSVNHSLSADKHFLKLLTHIMIEARVISIMSVGLPLVSYTLT